MGEAQESSSWADLPQDLLQLISRRLPGHLGSLRLRSVCTAWRSTVSLKPRFPPRLFHHSSGCYLSKRTVFALSPPPHRCSSGSISASPAAWLIKVEDLACPGKVRLSYPLTSEEYVATPLPSAFPSNINLLEFDAMELAHEYVYWSHDASFDLVLERLHADKLAVCFLGEHDVDFVVLAIGFPGRHLSMYRASDGGIQRSIAYDTQTPRFADLIAFHGQFYAVDSHGMTHVIHPQSMEVTKTVANKAEMCGETKRLVECGGELLLADICSKRVCCGSGQRIRIKLFKLHRNRESWVRSCSIDDHAVFLGEKSSFSAAASMLGCRGNRIVFEWVDGDGCSSGVTVHDEDVLRCRFIKVFDVGSGKLEDLTAVPDLMRLFWPPPSWMNTCKRNPLQISGPN